MKNRDYLTAEWVMIHTTHLMFALNQSTLLNQQFAKLEAEELNCFVKELSRFKNRKINLLIQRLNDVNIQKLFEEIDAKNLQLLLKSISYDNFVYVKRYLGFRVHLSDQDIQTKHYREAGCYQWMMI